MRPGTDKGGGEEGASSPELNYKVPHAHPEDTADMLVSAVGSYGMTALSDAFASIALPAGDALALTSTPLIGSAWRLSLNLGFVDNDHAAQRMGYVPPPKEWAASGARHPPLHVDVRFEEDQVHRPLEPDA